MALELLLVFKLITGGVLGIMVIVIVVVLVFLFLLEIVYVNVFVLEKFGLGVY